MIYIGVTETPNENDKNIWRHLRAEPTWNWNAGSKLRINCFTNCTEAELFINGKSLGTKPTNEQTKFIAAWKVPYQSTTCDACLAAFEAHHGTILSQSIGA